MVAAKRITTLFETLKAWDSVTAPHTVVVGRIGQGVGSLSALMARLRLESRRGGGRLTEVLVVGVGQVAEERRGRWQLPMPLEWRNAPGRTTPARAVVVNDADNLGEAGQARLCDLLGSGSDVSLYLGAQRLEAVRGTQLGRSVCGAAKLITVSRIAADSGVVTVEAVCHATVSATSPIVGRVSYTLDELVTLCAAFHVQSMDRPGRWQRIDAPAEC